MLIVYAPDGRAEALARTMEPMAPCLGLARADADVLKTEHVLLLVTTDYYSRGLWQMKRWLMEKAPQLEGKLFACLVQRDSDSGGELAIRSLVSQLLAWQSPVALCAAVCADGRIRPGGCAETRKNGMTPLEFCTKFREMAVKFG